MENSYNSLEEQLKKQGIIHSLDNEENIFVSRLEEAKSKDDTQQRKRINQYDLELLNNSSDEEINAYKVIKRFLDFKHNIARKGNLSGLDGLLYRFFPKLYKAKLVKDALSKLKELNIDTKILLDKTIPYGENESRYQNLIKYLNFASEIQTNIKNKLG